MKRIILTIVITLLLPMSVFASNITGDVNGDGKISISDYNLIRKYILNIAKLSSDELKRADTNNDNKISVSDYNKIRKIILGVISLEGNYAEVFFPNVYNNPNVLESVKDDPVYKNGYGYGLSLFIKTIDNKYILIDTHFNNEAVMNTIYDSIRKEQNKDKVNIDYMILTHSHADHTGNVLNILKSNKFHVDNVIMKRESKSSSIYDKVLSEMTKQNNKDGMIKLTSEGQKIAVGKYLEIYLFNTADVYKNATCHDKGYYYNFTHNINKATKINGKYYYFDGSLYPNIKLIETDKPADKYSTKKSGMDNYFYAMVSDAPRNDCNANANSLAIIIKVKTEKGNRYMYFSGDIDNSGYDITAIDDIYGNGLEIVFPEEKKIKLATDTKNGLLTGYVDDLNRVASETKASNSIKKTLGNDIKNILIYQASHHGINVAPDAIDILGLNKPSLYAVIPVSGNIGTYSTFSHTRTYYYALGKVSSERKLYPGGKTKNGVQCSINNLGNASCNNY